MATCGDQKKAIKPPRAVVIGGCEPSDVVIENAMKPSGRAISAFNH